MYSTTPGDWVIRLRESIFPLCKNAVGVFFGSSRLYQIIGMSDKNNISFVEQINQKDMELRTPDGTLKIID